MKASIITRRNYYFRSNVVRHINILYYYEFCKFSPKISLKIDFLNNIFQRVLKVIGFFI